ncbi:MULTISPECIES: DUF2850 domain-containing protein [Vibrio]|uniref:DUF2850 domain-containing protein n=1 Tax=Vibrio TaxID=662 RepID=UPI001AFC6DA0|nr:MULTISPECIES: DUF2850 domain-containing protein [Vibrio]WQE75593.1 DUF2850 domain-containing protein [Vibrio alfacsensis]BBM63977.1 hypothetical protein VA249_06230 [Vibrio alfacsensis]BCN24890.1 hypothetical protein VYA_20820 [Vibrio alfacsensis]CAE6895628.1 hypothetical protein ACOMICROBIO_GDFFDHBD_01197 [Vibrio sp. B1REV9]
MTTAVKPRLEKAQESSDKSMIRKWIERSLMLSAIVGSIVAFMLYGDLIARYINPPIDESIVYGKWIEQDVAPYAREEFVLSSGGVAVNGAIVATEFEFDGDSLSYKVGSTVRKFEFINQQHSEMKLDSNAHYLPVFRIEGHTQRSVR